MIQRHLKKIIEKHLFQKKTIILYGARQTGKTTLMELILEPYRDETLLLNGDDAGTREMLADPNATKLIPIIGDAKIVLLDEAQRIPETGLALKIIHNNFKDVQLIATGSSSFELASTIINRKLIILKSGKTNYWPFEIKWNPQKGVRLSKTFSNAYPSHEFKVISPANFHEFTDYKIGQLISGIIKKSTHNYQLPTHNC